MFRWVRRALLVIALVVLVGVAIIALTARPDLDGARDDVESRWRVLRPALADRYELLDEANSAMQDAGGPPRDITRSVSRALVAWRRDPNAPLDVQIERTNTLEALGRRLVVTVDASSRLRELPAVIEPVDAFREAPMPESARAFNTAVHDFEDARGGSLRRPIANALGYDSIPSLDVPRPDAPA
jgi:hypothetical protein